MTVGPGAVRLKGFRGCLENASEYQFPMRYGSHFFVRYKIKMEVAIEKEESCSRGRCSRYTGSKI